MKLVEVIWVDAMIEEGHLPSHAVSSMVPIERHSVGYLISSDDDCIKITYGTLENFYKGEKAYDMALVLPRCMIKSLSVVKK